MALVVQNDSGTEEAFAYIDVAFFRTYHELRGRAVTAFTDAQIEPAIVRATDFLDRKFIFVGDRLNTDQTTEWPRLSAYDRDDKIVNGIPLAVKQATAEYAFIALTQDLMPNPEIDSTGRTVQSKSSSVGPLAEAVTYTAGAPYELPRYPVADRILQARGLVMGRGRIYRG